jgi:hypothetical protein
MTTTDAYEEVAAAGNPIVLIYSGEHRAYWRPDGAGYTTDRDSAGRWWLEDAVRHTSHCGPEKKIEFHRAARPERIIRP